jgi:Bacterial regulatory proteins, luxR family
VTASLPESLQVEQVLEHINVPSYHIDTDELHVSPETVRNHVKRLLRAVGAHSRLEAVAIAHSTS